MEAEELQCQHQEQQLQHRVQVQNQRIVHRVELLVLPEQLPVPGQQLVQVLIHLQVLQGLEQLQHHRLHHEAG